MFEEVGLVVFGEFPGRGGGGEGGEVFEGGMRLAARYVLFRIWCCCVYLAFGLGLGLGFLELLAFLARIVSIGVSG